MKKRKQIFSIRKLTVGVASILIGTTLVNLNPNNTVSADSNLGLQGNHISSYYLNKPILGGLKFVTGNDLMFTGRDLGKVEVFDMQGNELGSADASQMGISLHRYLRPGEKIKVVPYSPWGDKGTAVYCYYTNDTDLLNAYHRYVDNDLQATTRFRNSSQEKQVAYVNALNRVKQLVDSYAEETPEQVQQAIQNLYQAADALDGQGEASQPTLSGLKFGGGRTLLFSGHDLGKIDVFDMHGNKLGSADPSQMGIEFHRDLQPGEKIKIVPYSPWGEKGTAVYCYYSDDRDLLDAYHRYAENNLQNTTRFKNSSPEKQTAYVNALNKVKQLTDSYAEETPEQVQQAIQNLYQAANALDGQGEATEPELTQLGFLGSRALMFEGFDVGKVEVFDMQGTRLGTGDPAEMRVNLNRNLRQGEKVKVIPYSPWGEEGTPIYCYYSDEWNPLIDAYNKYVKNDIENTTRFQNSSKAKQRAYIKALNKVKKLRYDYPEETPEQVQQAIRDLYQAVKDLDGKGESIQPANPSVPSTPGNDEPAAPFIPEVPTIPNNPGYSSNSNQEEFLSTILYAPVINGNRSWKIALRDSNGKLTGQYISTGTSWKVFGRKKINGVLYYRLGSQQQWVPAEYLNGKTSNNTSTTETKLSTTGYVARLANHPNWRIALYNSQGHVTSYLRPNSNWKVLASKRIKGRLMYRLGTENQWIPAQYIRVR